MGSLLDETEIRHRRVCAGRCSLHSNPCPGRRAGGSCGTCIGPAEIFDLDDDGFSFFAQVGALGGDVEGVKEAAHGGRSVQRRENAREVGGGGAGCRPRAAEFEEGARAAVGGVDGCGGESGGELGTHGGSEGVRLGAEGVVEGDIVAAVSRAVEERTGGDGGVQHFFEADRLRAELHGVDGFVLGAAAFVLDGEGAPRAVGLAVKLDDIGDAMEAESGGLEGEGAGGAEIAARFGAGFVRTVVEHAALGGEGIFGPLALDVDERALAGAEREVLQRRERKGIVGGGHEAEQGPRSAVAGVETDFAFGRGGRRVEQGEKFFDDVPEDEVVFEEFFVVLREALEDDGVGEQFFAPAH